MDLDTGIFLDYIITATVSKKPPGGREPGWGVLHARLGTVVDPGGPY